MLGYRSVMVVKIASLFSAMIFGAIVATSFWYLIYLTNFSIYVKRVYRAQSTFTGRNEISSLLHKKVRIFCWIMSGSYNRSRFVKQTWVKRCNKYIFVSSKADRKLPSIVVDVPDGRNYLWAKTKAAFKYIYDHENLLNYDWYLKADDDTYVVMENLRYMLLPYSPDDRLYLGCRIKTSLTNGYNSGGAGYVLSRAALIEFVSKSLPYDSKCRRNHDGNEDIEMGECLQSLSIYPVDTRDGNDRHRFMVDTPGRFLDFDPTFLFYDYTYYPMDKSYNCCSEHPVSFHYVEPKLMLTLEYLLYYAKVFGEETSSTSLSQITDQSVHDVGSESILRPELREAETFT